MKAEHIINACITLHKCAEALINLPQPADRGRLSAEATIAMIALRVHSGINEAEIHVEGDKA
jgi:hypothetical protein